MQGFGKSGFTVLLGFFSGSHDLETLWRVVSIFLNAWPLNIPQQTSCVGTTVWSDYQGGIPPRVLKLFQCHKKAADGYRVAKKQRWGFNGRSTELWALQQNQR